MPKPWPLILALLLTAGAVFSLLAVDHARAVDDPDANWQTGLHAPGNPDVVLQSLGAGLNGTVRVTCPLDGSVVASGDFTATADCRVQLWHAGVWDGTAWQPLAGGLPASALTLEPLAGGSFTHVGPARIDGLARWRDGRWLPVGSGMNGAIQDLLGNRDEFWASGAFSAAGRVPSPGIAHWQEPRAGTAEIAAPGSSRLAARGTGLPCDPE